MPYARHMGLKVFVGTHASDSLLAAEDAIADFQDWAQDDEQATAVVQDVTFEFVTETKMALYVIYSN